MRMSRLGANSKVFQGGREHRHGHVHETFGSQVPTGEQ